MSADSTSSAVRPLFLLSLPRSGSTLVQRVLAAHPKISTTAEPWILLPLLYAQKWNGVRAEYSHQLAADAIVDFANALDGGQSTFELRLRTFVEQLYRDAAEDGATYFLDKTPRYHHIVDDLLRLFPDGRFLFLWRNPLAVVASLLETYRQNQFEPYEFPAELVRAPSALTGAFAANRDRVHAVRYEDLIGPNRERHWQGVFEYLQLDWDPQLLERFSRVQLQGRFMDPTGVQRYSQISTEPLEKWKHSFRGPVRQQWGAWWLRRLGPGPVEIMGYDPDRLLDELRHAGSAPVSAIARDGALLTGSMARRLMRKQALRIQDIPRMLGPNFNPRPRVTVQLARNLRRALHG